MQQYREKYTSYDHPTFPMFDPELELSPYNIDLVPIIYDIL